VANEKRSGFVNAFQKSTRRPQPLEGLPGGWDLPHRHLLANAVSFIRSPPPEGLMRPLDAFRGWEGFPGSRVLPRGWNGVLTASETAFTCPPPSEPACT